MIDEVKIQAVYPRWRGEHRILNRGGIHFGGLSPLARGTQSLLSQFYEQIRFIPAGAGNTANGFAASASCTVYPRWRGEHGSMVADNRSTFGLSPLARGTRADCRSNRWYLRFIPAGAGNTMAQIQLIKISAVYPRWRGEHPAAIFFNVTQLGLSPLARGTLYDCRRYEKPRRFIPAGAGNTNCLKPPLDQFKVYPRWRGEHHIAVDENGIPYGLSPLARGTPKRDRRDAHAGRFIPAGAGNTQAAWTIHVRATVYPRWRGEHHKRRTEFRCQYGLSPLARGTHPSASHR